MGSLFTSVAGLALVPVSGIESSTSKAASSAKDMDLIVPGRRRATMLWLCRSRGKEFMAEAWVRRWMCSVSEPGAEMATYVDRVVEEGEEVELGCYASLSVGRS